MTYHLSIAGVPIRWDIPFPIQLGEETRPFLTEATEPAYSVTLEPVDEISLLRQGTWQNDLFFVSDGEGFDVYHTPCRGMAPYARASWRRGEPDRLMCAYCRGQERMLAYSRNIQELMGTETFLLQHGALLLHASLIQIHGQGILFTAPSGTGKSTQAELWARFEQADILNGDRAGLRKADGVWNAYGLPWAGTSGIYRADGAPVRAIVVLRQGKENRICRLEPGEAMRRIYPELTIHRWDPAFVNAALNLLLDLLASVPVYQLDCLPDRGAVDVLKHELFPGGDCI